MTRKAYFGVLPAKPFTSCIKTILCNNLLFTGFTDEGEERGLKLDEVHNIIDYIYNTRQELMDEVHAMMK
ncbi:hypothetical protein [Selenomonas ruminantium]|uniref:hypothetical protein n=1 Tax=Selenomonas ruminantium TaxID=971 RepID=UPI0003F9BE2E|nr:hypothetical protein [Selenomonas ruminantium]